MGEMADELDLQEFNLTHLPETHRRYGWGKYTFVDDDGVKHWFKTLKDANEWAKKRGFKLSTKPTNSKERDSR